MDSRFKEVRFYEIEYDDFDNFITETFGKEYECVADNEWNNYSSYNFNVEIRLQDLKEDSFFMLYTVTNVEKWLKKEKNKIDAQSLLDYLVWKGVIPAGKYLIKVFW